MVAAAAGATGKLGVAERLGIETDMIVQQLGWDEDVDDDVRAAIEIDEWLFWQVGGLGPMAGQAHHFRRYAPSIVSDSRLTAYGSYGGFGADGEPQRQ